LHQKIDQSYETTAKPLFSACKVLGRDRTKMFHVKHLGIMHLTNKDDFWHQCAVASKEVTGAPDEEIEVTAEMARVGRECIERNLAVMSLGWDCIADEWVKEAFVAMWNKRNRQSEV
jgi:hypothetical protein